MKPELLKRIALLSNPERYSAYLAMLQLRAGYYEVFGDMIERAGNYRDVPRFLRFVADAWDGKSGRFGELTPTGIYIIEAWYAAYLIAGLTDNGFDPSAKPTLWEVKTQYGLLFSTPLPTDWTIRKTLKRCKLPLRTVPTGRPKGRKGRAGVKRPKRHRRRQRRLK